MTMLIKLGFTLKVVTNVDASSTIDNAGFEVVCTKAGNSHVSNDMENGGDFG